MPRLPTQLKKRLQANLEQLTAKEAGRLLLIYTREAEKKYAAGQLKEDVYPPTKELWNALENRVAKSRGKPEEKEAVRTYNGVIFLRAVVGAVNTGDFLHLLTGFAFDSYRVMVQLAIILQEDSTTELIRFLKGRIIDETPKPLPKDDYRRVVDWANSNSLYDLWEAAQIMVEGDDDPSRDDDNYEDDIDRIHAALLAKYQAGELVGGEAVYHSELEAPVLIVDGKLPAWAALRLVWKPFLFRQGYKILDQATFEDWSPDMVDQVFGSDNQLLTLEALRKIAGDFYKACRRRPWGKGLIAKPDLDNLVKLLTQTSNPFLHLNPADFGRIDWEAFRKSEPNWSGYRRLEENEESFESEPVATVASLDAVASEFCQGVTLGRSWHEDHYYPSAHPESRRQDLARMFGMMAGLETSRQPFTYGWRAKEEGELSLSELLGVDFLTPLERKVADLRRINSQAVSIRRALQTISDRYFDGLPVLMKMQEEPLLEGEKYLKTATETMTAWLDRLARWPWEIDTSSLRIEEPEADEEEVEYFVNLIIKAAKRESRIENPDAQLGEE